MFSKWLAPVLAVAAFGALAGSANAAPLSNLATSVESSAQPVAYRRCWYRHGVVHCRRAVVVRRYYDDGYYDPYYRYGYYDDPYYYGRPYYGYGYGPGVGLYFGGFGHRHRW